MFIDKDGYRRMPLQYGSKLEHRMVVEEHIGRPLTDKEVVHHINHNKLDNRIENLEILNRAQHSDRHNIFRSMLASENNHKEKHPRWKQDITKEMLFESFDRNRSFNKMQKELGIDGRTISARFRHYGYRIVRKRAQKGRGWENYLAEVEA